MLVAVNIIKRFKMPPHRKYWSKNQPCDTDTDYSTDQRLHDILNRNYQLDEFDMRLLVEQGCYRIFINQYVKYGESVYQEFYNTVLYALTFGEMHKKLFYLMRKKRIGIFPSAHDIVEYGDIDTYMMCVKLKIIDVDELFSAAIDLELNGIISINMLEEIAGRWYLPRRLRQDTFLKMPLRKEYVQFLKHSNSPLNNRLPEILNTQGAVEFYVLMEAINQQKQIYAQMSIAIQMTPHKDIVQNYSPIILHDKISCTDPFMQNDVTIYFINLRYNLNKDLVSTIVASPKISNMYMYWTFPHVREIVRTVLYCIRRFGINFPCMSHDYITKYLTGCVIAITRQPYLTANVFQKSANVDMYGYNFENNQNNINYFSDTDDDD